MADCELLVVFYEKMYNRNLTEEEVQIIRNSFRKEICKKKQLIFGSGDTNTRHYFVVKGLLRLYVIDNSGKEFNVLFARENQWIGDLATPEETSFYLDAVEKSIVYSISNDNLNRLTDNFALFVNYLRKSYIFLQKRLVSVLTNTAEENYEELLNNYPELINRLPQYHISSYLGVTPVFLSKILAKRARKKE